MKTRNTRHSRVIKNASKHASRAPYANLDEAQVHDLWENHPELTAEDIASMFGVTKSTIIGRANRRGWARAGTVIDIPPTMFDRLASIHAKMDRVLVETAPFMPRKAPPVVDAA